MYMQLLQCMLDAEGITADALLRVLHTLLKFISSHKCKQQQHSRPWQSTATHDGIDQPTTHQVVDQNRQPPLLSNAQSWQYACAPCSYTAERTTTCTDSADTISHLQHAVLLLMPAVQPTALPPGA
jgi:hypothetical protein